MSQYIVLTVCLLGYFACFCRLLIFIKINFLEKISRISLECQTVWDPGQARHFVGPDLGPNGLGNIISRQQY